MNLPVLLEKNRMYRPSFDDGACNHLSMGLIALQRLGAGDDRLDEFYGRTHDVLEPLGPVQEPIDTDRWGHRLGGEDSFEAYLDFFSSRIAAKGRTAALEAFLPRLMAGLGAELFHPMIRLAYGLETQDDHDVAHALAYFADTHLPLAEPGERSDISDQPEEIFDQLQGQTTLQELNLSGRFLTEKMQQLADLPEFSRLVDGLVIGPDTLGRIAELVLRFYLTLPGMPSLHCVTGTHALRVLGSQMVDKDRAVYFLWQAICAVYVIMGMPTLDTHAAAPIPDGSRKQWREQLAKAAIVSDDVHVIKLTYTCLREEQVYGNPAYLQAAALVGG